MKASAKVAKTAIGARCSIRRIGIPVVSSIRPLITSVPAHWGAPHFNGLLAGTVREKAYADGNESVVVHHELECWMVIERAPVIDDFECDGIRFDLVEHLPVIDDQVGSDQRIPSRPVHREHASIEFGDFVRLEVVGLAHGLAAFSLKEPKVLLVYSSA